jgi:predicted metal-dependent hydrolase
MTDRESRPGHSAGYSYVAKQVDQITVRRFSFEFPDDLEPRWIPDQVVRSHLFNGFSLTMPYLEPFLVKTMREAAGFLQVPELLEDIRHFNGQEASHYKCHRRLNELLKANGYPELAEVEQRLERSYTKLSKKSLCARLAYSAGFECMTNGFTNWLINKRTTLFTDASPHVASFWLMHMVEETEHKTVAFDTYMAYSGRYLPRVVGVFHGSFHVLGYGFIGMFAALRKDRALKQPGTIKEIVRETASLAWHVGPYLLRALLPWHNPRGEADPQWMRDWIVGHAATPAEEALPLVDTHSADMPVPFNRA